MKIPIKMASLIFIFFCASYLQAAYEDHNGECHDKEKNPVTGCKLCDAMSSELSD